MDNALNDYQGKAFRTSTLVHMDHPSVYSVMGLASEAGEVAGKLKKIFRDKNGVFSDADVKDLKKELGDCLWYIADTCSRLGFSMEEIASMNIEKLKSRAVRGVISGDGDDR